MYLGFYRYKPQKSSIKQTNKSLFFVTLYKKTLCQKQMSRNISSLWIGTIWEQFYDAAVNNFDAAMKYISKHGL